MRKTDRTPDAAAKGSLAAGIRKILRGRGYSDAEIAKAETAAKARAGEGRDERA